MAKSSVHVKKDDQVIVISGKDKGAKGKVLMVDEKKGRVYVEGVNMVKKHQKARSPCSARCAPVTATAGRISCPSTRGRTIPRGTSTSRRGSASCGAFRICGRY